MRKKVLVTGGAGYIGSHVVKLLGKNDFDVLSYDNLSSGNEWAVLSGDLVVGDLEDAQTLCRTIASFKPDAVIHFAASIVVPESTRDPIKYYKNNVSNAVNLLEAMRENSIKNFIFSSTAAVYGTPQEVPIYENSPTLPINPYGQTKLIVEKILNNLASADLDFKHISLRYFNVAGADPECKIGQAYRHEATHLLTRALRTARGKYDHLDIFGTDYPTKDGTCIRDYIHVDDLSRAHLLALEHIMSGNKSDTYNCGYGHGYSVKEMVDMVKKVTDTDFKVVESSRRQGDSSELVSDSSKIRKNLKWNPEFDDLEYIVKTAWDWEKKLDEILAKCKKTGP